MAKEKEKKVRQKINWKKEMKLAPGYIVIMDSCGKSIYNNRHFCGKSIEISNRTAL